MSEIPPPEHAPYGQLPTGGTVRPITRWGTPVMHRPQQQVTVFDEALRALVADMVAADLLVAVGRRDSLLRLVEAAPAGSARDALTDHLIGSDSA